MNVHEVKQWLTSISQPVSHHKERRAAWWFLKKSKKLTNDQYRKKVELFIVGTNYYNQVLTILNEEEDVNQGTIEYCSMARNITRRYVCEAN